MPRQVLTRLPIFCVAALFLSGCGSDAPGNTVENAPLTSRDGRLTGNSREKTQDAIILVRPERNFAFTFNDGRCGYHRVDTFKKKYTKNMLDEPSITIDLRLTEVEQLAIYSKMIEIDFFSYPKEFSIPVPENGMRGMVVPASDYHFSVRNGEQLKELNWVDEITHPNTEEADNLRELIKLIQDTLDARPEVKELPERNYQCA